MQLKFRKFDAGILFLAIIGAIAMAYMVANWMSVQQDTPLYITFPGMLIAAAIILGMYMRR